MFQNIVTNVPPWGNICTVRHHQLSTTLHDSDTLKRERFIRFIEDRVWLSLFRNMERHLAVDMQNLSKIERIIGMGQ